MHVKALKQPLRVVSPPAEVGKRLQLCSKEDMVVFIPSLPKEVPKDVPVQTVTETVAILSEERKPGSDTKGTIVTVEEDVPLSGLNMQLKKVQDDACKTVDKGQRWSLFQTQCTIKGKACKLMIDGGSCINDIRKAMVAALGLSTWHLPEPKHLEWLNSCGILKITHKVRVPFTVDDYVDEIECDVLPLEVCGLLLGRSWQYDRNVTHAGRANTYSFMHGGKRRTLKPLGDDHIKSDVKLVVLKEKLHKPNVQHEVHDVPSVNVGDVSATPVDNTPVLVGDKPDEATLVVDVDVAACATVLVCVDASTQTDDVCADGVSMHMAQMRVGGVGGERVSGDSGQRHYRARSTAVQFSATPRMHRGNDVRPHSHFTPTPFLMPPRARLTRHSTPESKMATADLGSTEWERSKTSAQDINLLKKLGINKQKNSLRFPSEESYPSPPMKYRNHKTASPLPSLPEGGEVEERAVVTDDNQGTSRPESEVAGSQKSAASSEKEVESEPTASAHSPPSAASPRNKRKRDEVADSGTSKAGASLAEEIVPDAERTTFNPYEDALVSS
ncbi:hypothetical protein QYE76_023873 [Lolium multiflorum]|uniref:Uncharacterized protein n=1 Tax=Lolium multiflorum TaxID=4521 RepID=A0AAD8RD10_LOLMU|nr:hypothetical protein QYE76_023873 [Lolium multiflorum]